VVTLSATDDNTGVALTEYSLDIGDTWVPYNEAFVLRDEAEYTLWYRSIDETGNVEEAKEVVLNTSLITNPGLVTAQTVTSRGGFGTRIRPVPLPTGVGSCHYATFRSGRG